MQVAGAEALMGAVARDAAGLLLALEHEHVRDAEAAQLHGARQPGRAGADDDRLAAAPTPAAGRAAHRGRGPRSASSASSSAAQKKPWQRPIEARVRRRSPSRSAAGIGPDSARTSSPLRDPLAEADDAPEVGILLDQLRLLVGPGEALADVRHADLGQRCRSARARAPLRRAARARARRSPSRPTGRWSGSRRRTRIPRGRGSRAGSRRARWPRAARHTAAVTSWCSSAGISRRPSDAQMCEPGGGRGGVAACRSSSSAVGPSSRLPYTVGASSTPFVVSLGTASRMCSQQGSGELVEHDQLARAAA